MKIKLLPWQAFKNNILSEGFSRDTISGLSVAVVGHSRISKRWFAEFHFNNLEIIINVPHFKFDSLEEQRFATKEDAIYAADQMLSEYFDFIPDKMMIML